MRYRILGAWRGSGQEAIVEVEASDPMHAEEIGNERGILVSRVTQIGRVVSRPRGDTGAHARAGVDARGLADLLLFRRMVTPWLIRAGFYLVTLFTLIGVVTDLANVVNKQTPSGGRGVSEALFWAPMPAASGPMAFLGPIFTGLVAILVARVIAEMFIVTFQISESLTELRDDMRLRR